MGQKLNNMPEVPLPDTFDLLALGIAGLLAVCRKLPTALRTLLAPPCGVGDHPDSASVPQTRRAGGACAIYLKADVLHAVPFCKIARRLRLHADRKVALSGATGLHSHLEELFF